MLNTDEIKYAEPHQTFTVEFDTYPEGKVDLSIKYTELQYLLEKNEGKLVEDPPLLRIAMALRDMLEEHKVPWQAQ